MVCVEALAEQDPTLKPAAHALGREQLITLDRAPRALGYNGQRLALYYRREASLEVAERFVDSALAALRSIERMPGLGSANSRPVHSRSMTTPSRHRDMYSSSVTCSPRSTSE